MKCLVWENKANYFQPLVGVFTVPNDLEDVTLIKTKTPMLLNGAVKTPTTG
jgi:hypothetical protein